MSSIPLTGRGVCAIVCWQIGRSPRAAAGMGMSSMYARQPSLNARAGWRKRFLTIAVVTSAATSAAVLFAPTSGAADSCTSVNGNTVTVGVGSTCSSAATPDSVAAAASTNGSTGNSAAASGNSVAATVGLEDSDGNSAAASTDSAAVTVATNDSNGNSAAASTDSVAIVAA